MKFKIDFVTNSSSASFSIPLDKLTEVQRIMIHNHLDGAKMSMQVDIYQYTQVNSGWTITEENGEILGYTSMDNFDMQAYLLEVLKIPEEYITYEGNG